MKPQLATQPEFDFGLATADSLYPLDRRSKHLFPAAQLVREAGKDKVLELFRDDKDCTRYIEATAEFQSNEDTSLACLFSGFAMTGLPHRRPENDKNEAWTRQNGRFTLMIEPGSLLINRESVKCGVPYGSRARLIMLYLQSEAVRTNSRIVELGSSMSRWMANMGVGTGGGNYAAIREQSRRISACRISVGWQADEEKPASDRSGNPGFQRANIVSSMLFARNGDETNSQSSWESTCMLSTEFFEALQHHPVPVLEAAIKAINNSSLSMDLYCWLAYRLHSLNKPINISWAALQSQFGTDAPAERIRDFRRRFLVNLNEVFAVYPEAQIAINETAGLTLHPSPPPVPERGNARLMRAS